jgi:glucokinase
VEGVLSGPGLVNIFRFTHQERCAVIDARARPAALPSLITEAGLNRDCPWCIETLELFVSVYGAEAGNMALRSVATAGVYVGGGIAPKILPALQTGAFLEAFRAKGPMTDLLAAVPVSVILNRHAGLLGAAVRANAAGEPGA